MSYFCSKKYIFGTNEECIEEMKTLLTKYNLSTKHFWVLALPFLLILIGYFLVYKAPLQIISEDPALVNVKTVLKAHDDRSEGGKSVCEILSGTSQAVIYKYTLNDGYPFPNIDVRYEKPKSVYFDLSAYNYVHVKISATKGTRVPLILDSYIEDYTKKDDILSYFNQQFILNVNPQEHVYEVKLSDFTTPEWWYSNKGVTEKDLPKPDLSKTRYMVFANCINLKHGQEDIIKITEFSFHVDMTPYYIVSCIFFIIYFGVFWFVVSRKKVEKQSTEIRFQYEKTHSVNHSDKEEDAVFGYLAAHYFEQDLTIIDVQTETGIHERKISGIIKKKTELNFKQFLNKLRLAEAKRLLTETDLQISEIAFKVGYGNASHFNRVFKAEENCSPNDFRKSGNQS